MKIHKYINFGNPLGNMVGNCYVTHKPTNREIIDNLLEAMAEFNGTCWNPVDLKGGTDLMLNQCPGGCGHVWKLRIKNQNVSNWLVNEINARRFK